MTRVVTTPTARQDLDRIVRYIAQDNLAAALGWLDEVERLFDLLANHQGLGERVRTGRFGEIRRQFVGSYLIFYRPFDDGVEILHVIHGARDQDRLI